MNRSRSESSDVAIVGMACLFPQSPTLGDFWDNVVQSRCAISDPPPDWVGRYAADPMATRNDRIGNTRGGFLGPLAQFDPIRYGVQPHSIDGSEPEHFLALRVAGEALADAGVPEIALNRERTDVILGRSTFVNRGLTSLHQHGLLVHQLLTVLKQLHPEYTPAQLQALEQVLRSKLPPFDAQTSPGMVSSIMSGRIANRLDLHGRNYCVDGACASSLLAVEQAIAALTQGTCDAALAGGVHVSLNPLVMMMFTQLGALSSAEALKPFSSAAAGTLLCEGVGVVVLKRLADAERDGNRIYCVIKGVGTSSDGKAKSVVAPRVEGQELALRRAYQVAGVDPQSVRLLEAHGTGMPLGDQIELESLSRVFGAAGETHYAVGSVKSNFGHALSAAGIAGLIKTALALYERVLPATRCDELPLPALADPSSPLYLNTRTRPWLQGAGQPRRAGVNAFGFGGVNAHAVLEEYSPNEEQGGSSIQSTWDTELCVFCGDSRDELIGALDQVRGFLENRGDAALKDVAYTLGARLSSQAHRLSILADSSADLRSKIELARERLVEGKDRIKDRRGIFYFQRPLGREGKIAFVFPGEGAQYENMLSDLCQHFPQVRGCFDRVETAFERAGIRPPLSRVLYPPPDPTGKKKEQESALWRMDYAVQSVTTANRALYRLFEDLGVAPHMVVGHSSGEFAALEASGAICLNEQEAFFNYIEGGMRTVQRVGELVETLPEVRLIAASADDREVFGKIAAQFGGRMLVAMDNCPFQIIACGDPQSAAEWTASMHAEGINCTELPFRRAYHTPWFAPACRPLREYYDGLEFVPPKISLYSCASASQYPQEPDAIRDLAFSQWCLPVRFQETILAMYAAGARVFVEIGTRGNLASFIDDALRDRTHEAIRTNVPQRTGIRQLCEALGLLIAHHVPVNLEPLFARRRLARLDWSSRNVAGQDRASTRQHVAMQLPFIELSQADLKELAKHGLGIGGNSQASEGATTDAAPHSPHKGSSSSNGKSGLSPGPPIPSNDVHPARAAVAAPAPSRPLPPKPSGASTQAVPTARHIPAETATEAHAQDSQVLTMPGEKSPRGEAMARHFDVMSQFLAVQRNALAGLEQRRGRNRFAGASGAERSSGTPAVERKGILPFVQEVLEEVSAREILIRRVLDVSEDLYLADHVLGGRVSMYDRTQTALPVNPLTMSIEMLAEVAARMLPGKTVLAIQKIRAHRWMVVDGQLELHMKGIGLGPDRVYVSIRETSPDFSTQSPIIEAEVLLGDTYPEPPSADAFTLQNPRESRFRPEMMYKTAMFSGPRFQAIHSIQTWAEDGQIGTLHSLPTNDLFRSVPEPHLIAAPVLLDAAGQTIAHWNGEDDAAGFRLFPYYVDEVRLYAPATPSPPLLQSQLRIASTRGEGIDGYRADIRLVDSDGKLWAEIRGWRVKVFDLPETFYGMLHDQIDVKLGEAWSAPLIQFLPNYAERCGGQVKESDCALSRVMDFRKELLLGHGRIWMKALARQIFSAKELAIWHAMSAADSRKVTYLLGRVAAKDAVRRLLRQNFGLQLCPGDIEIDNEASGAPIALPGPWSRNGPLPRISIAHCGEVAVAIAARAEANVQVGIDVECSRVWEQRTVSQLFSAHEQALLTGLDQTAQQSLLSRFWCSKEAVAKALRTGLGADPSSLVVRSYERSTEICEIEVGGHLGEMRPDLRGRRIISQTWIENAITIGVAFCQCE